MRRQVDDGVEALQVLGLDVAQVDAQPADGHLLVAEGAALEQVAVQAGDVVAGGPQHRGHDAADVPLVPGEKDPHGQLCQIAQAGRPVSCIDSRRCRSLSVSIGAQNPS